MAELIVQEFKDEIKPVRIDHDNGDGDIVTIVDWELESQSRIPRHAVNVQFSFTLEYLNFHYHFPTLNKIPTSQLPLFKLSENDITKQAKTVEFKRKFTATENYAVQFLLWRWYDGRWREDHNARDTLNNLGLEGHISVLNPYFIEDGDVIFGSLRHKFGLSVNPRSLLEGDYIEINGGYSGTVSYLLQPEEVELVRGTDSARNVGNTPIELLDEDERRAALFLSNNGRSRLYWRFGSIAGFSMQGAPFLEPGESLSYEHGRLNYSGGNSHLLPPFSHRTIIKMPLYAVREEGNGMASYQTFRFPSHL